MNTDMVGLIQPVEGEFLAELAAKVPADRTIVEIGAHTGLSTCWLGNGAREGNGAHVITVDPWLDPDPALLPFADPFEFGTGDAVLARCMDNLASEDLLDTVTVIRATSLEVASWWVNPVGMVWIDALHDYEPACADARAWAPKVQPGGYLVFHDYWADPQMTVRQGVAGAIDDVVVPMGCYTDVTMTWNTWSACRM